VGGKQGVVQLWDTARGLTSSGQTTNGGVMVGARFAGHGDQDVRAVAISPDGSFFVSAAGSSVLIWPGPSKWRDLVCRKLGHNMSQEQWESWVDRVTPYKEQCPGLPRAAEPITTAANKPANAG